MLIGLTAIYSIGFIVINVHFDNLLPFVYSSALLGTCVSFLKYNDLKFPIYPLGAGSNIIIRDRGFNGVIIHFNKLKEIFIDKQGIITAYCGAMDADVARFARNHSKTGLEFLIGIPGTIGGGIKMNSGAYGSEIKNILIDVTAINKNGILKKFTVKDLQPVSYTHLTLPTT